MARHKPYVDSGVFYVEPTTSRPDLLMALRHAAIRAELVRLAGTSDANEMERRIFGVSTPQLKGTFRHVLRGGGLSPQVIDSVTSRYPKSPLAWWADHPIGRILCDGSLRQDGLLDAMGTLPRCLARRSVWDERWSGAFTMFRQQIEVPDSPEVISVLRKKGSVSALLVLLGRMRICVLRGYEGLGIGRSYEEAIYAVAKRVVRRSAHFSGVRKELYQAIDGFLEWAPYVDERLYRMMIGCQNAWEVVD
jgi:hypothetical protein